MTPTEADDLAQLIAQTWHGGPRAIIWKEELEQMHLRQARVVYDQLKKTEDRAPTIALFWTKYHALTDHREQYPEATCESCVGSGWVSAPEHMRHSRLCPVKAGAAECHCSAVVPCRCKKGQGMQRLYAELSKPLPKFEKVPPPAGLFPLPAPQPVAQDVPF